MCARTFSFATSATRSETPKREHHARDRASSVSVTLLIALHFMVTNGCADLTPYLQTSKLSGETSKLLGDTRKLSGGTSKLSGGTSNLSGGHCARVSHLAVEPLRRPGHAAARHRVGRGHIAPPVRFVSCRTSTKYISNTNARQLHGEVNTERQ